MNSSSRSRGNAAASRHPYGNLFSSSNEQSGNGRRNSIGPIDEYHNGQTPACRVLVEATRDVFAELQPSEGTSDPSLLGQMIRAVVLEERWKQHNSNESNNATNGSADKKKKKRKKKKKGKGKQTQNQQEEDNQDEEIPAIGSHAADDVDAVLNFAAVAAAATPLEEANHSSDEKTIPYESSAEISVIPQDGTHHGGDMDFVLDDESNDQQSPSSAIRRVPSLNSLPSDDGILDNEDVPEVSFQQIRPQIDDKLAGMDEIDRREIHEAATGLELLATSAFDPLSAAFNGSLSHRLYTSAIESQATSNVERRMDRARIRNPLNLQFLKEIPYSDNEFSRASAVENTSASGDDSPTDSSTLYDNWLDHLLKPSYPSDEEDESPTTRPLLHPPTSNVPSSRTLKSFAQYLSSNSKCTSIPYQNLMDACNIIECFTCKDAAIEYLDRLDAYLYPKHQIENGDGEKEKPPRLVLNLKTLDRPQNGAGQEVVMGSPHDYYALEEGTMPQHGREEFENDLKNSDVTCCMTFTPESMQDGKKALSSCSKALRVDPINGNHIENIARQWLPCGIDETMTGLSMASQNEQQQELSNSAEDEQDLQIFQAEVETSEGDACRGLKDLRQLSEILKANLKESERLMEKKGGRMEFKIFPNLKDIDKKCVEFLDKIVNLLKMFTSSTSPALHDLQLFLWDNVLTRRGLIFRSIEIYYDGLEEALADANGRLPQAFTSSELRNFFHSVVSIKVRECCELFDSVDEALTPEKMREWFSHVAWVGRHSPKLTRSHPVDNLFFHLMLELNQWSVIHFGSRVSDIRDQQNKMMTKLLDVLQSAVKPLLPEYNQVEQYFAPELNHYFQNLGSDVRFAKGVCDQMELMDQNEVECMSTGAIYMWRHVRFMQAKWKTPQPPMPRLLRRWMTQGPQNGENEIEMQRVQFHHYHQPNGLPLGSSLNQHPPCPNGGGNGGKRRVMCILAGLTYQWLKEECMEWNAQLAEEELLGLEEKAKPVAKKKKKKGKKGKQVARTVTPEPTPIDDPLEESTSTDGDLSKDVATEEAASDEATEIMDQLEEPTEEHNQTQGIDSNMDGDAIADIASVEKQEEDEHPTIVLLDDDDYIVHQDDYKLRAGVMGDDNKFQSAEDFLVSRMRALLSGGPNVIVL